MGLVTVAQVRAAGFGSPGAVMEATEYIQQYSQPEDSIFVWGMDASIYYFSDRHCSNRLCTSLPLMVGAGTPTRAAYRQEFLESLAASPPAFIAVEPLPDLILGGHYELSDFPEFERLLSVEYEPVAEYGEIAIFRQKTKETDSIAGR